MNRRGELDGWDEIAEFLGVSPRTAQNHERNNGLPIRRLPGVKGRVWALSSEIEQWKHSRDRAIDGKIAAPTVAMGSQPQAAEIAEAGQWPEAVGDESFGSLSDFKADRPGSPQRAEVGPRSVLRSGERWYDIPAVRWFAFGVLITIFTAAVVLLTMRERRTVPVKFRVDGNILKTFDVQGKEVWEFTLPGSTLHYIGPEQLGPADNPRGVFADINNDGKQEFLFFNAPKADGRTALYCFDSRGNLVWTRRPGRDVTTEAGSTIMDDYWTNAIGVLNHARKDGGRIVMLSHHAFSWPSQVVILTAEGKPVAEYWHPGWLFGMVIADLDGDGVDEIIFGGVNNGFQNENYGATLVILDSRFVSGQGHVPAGDTAHHINDVRQASEAAVLLFPEFKYLKADQPEPYCRIEDLQVIGNHIEFVVGKGRKNIPYVHYQLDPGLQVASITSSQPYEDRFLKGLSPAQRQARLANSLAHLKVLRNRFANRAK